LDEVLEEEEEKEEEKAYEEPDEDVGEMADLYTQLHDELCKLKEIPPTSESIHSMACSIFIERGKSLKSRGGQSGGFTRASNLASKVCPDCGSKVDGKISSRTDKPYWRCDGCDVWINPDGRTTPVRK